MGGRVLMLVAWPTWSAQLAGRWSLVSCPVLYMPVTAFGCITLLVACGNICRGRCTWTAWPTRSAGRRTGGRLLTVHDCLRMVILM